MTPTVTIHQAYKSALEDLHSISDSPALDTQLLLANAMKRSRAWILAHPEAVLRPNEAIDFSQSISRYRTGEALPYILGSWEFYGRSFQINNSVLIPRPETEHLVETAISYLQSRPGYSKVFDVGTGSGCIAISIALEVQDIQIVASDISWEALEVARSNADRYRVGAQVQFVQMDLDHGLEGEFDLVCANLPYIPTSTLELLEVGHKEPVLALDGGKDGFRYIRPILKDLPALLLTGGCALFELEAGSGEVALQMAKTELPDAKLKLLQDLAGHDRVLIVQT